MPLLRTTWITQLARHSFSESWYRQASSSDPTAEVVIAKQYAVERAKLLGFGCFIYAIRISNADDKRQKAYLQYVNYPGDQRKDGDGNPIHGSAASNVALNMEFRNAGNTQTKELQLRGIWDDTETVGGSWDSNNPEWVGLLQGFGAKIAALNYGWMYTSTVQIKSLAGYTQATNGLVTFSTAGDFFTVDQVASTSNVQCRIAKCVSSPNLNGQITLKPLTATTGITIRPIAVNPFVAGGTVQRNTKLFTACAGGQVQRIGKRQAGAPLLQSVGRGRVRPRG